MTVTYVEPDRSDLVERNQSHNDRYLVVHSDDYDVRAMAEPGGVVARVLLLHNKDGSYHLLLRPPES